MGRRKGELTAAAIDRGRSLSRRLNAEVRSADSWMPSASTLERANAQSIASTGRTLKELFGI